MPGCAVRRSVKFICLKVDRKQSTLRERERERDRDRDRDRERQADRQADRDRQRQTQRQSQRDRDTQRETGRQRERERERVPIMYVNVTQEISTNSFTGVTVECTLYSLLPSVCDHPLLLLSLLTSTKTKRKTKQKQKRYVAPAFRA